MKILLPLISLAALLVFQTGCESPGQVKPLTRTITATPDFQGAHFDLKDVDQPPKAIKRTQPVYPFNLKRKGISGYALLEFIIDTSGKPVQIQAVRASNEAFIGAAIDSLSEWRFKPALKNGEPCACRMQQPFSFDIFEH